LLYVMMDTKKCLKHKLKNVLIVDYFHNYSLITRSAVYTDPFLTYATGAGAERYQLPVYFFI
jgi:hypothetical protein